MKGRLRPKLRPPAQAIGFLRRAQTSSRDWQGGTPPRPADRDTAGRGADSRCGQTEPWPHAAHARNLHKNLITRPNLLIRYSPFPPLPPGGEPPTTEPATASKSASPSSSKPKFFELPELQNSSNSLGRLSPRSDLDTRSSAWVQVRPRRSRTKRRGRGWTSSPTTFFWGCGGASPLAPPTPRSDS